MALAVGQRLEDRVEAGKAIAGAGRRLQGVQRGQGDRSDATARSTASRGGRRRGSAGAGRRCPASRTMVAEPILSRIGRSRRRPRRARLDRAANGGTGQKYGRRMAMMALEGHPLLEEFEGSIELGHHVDRSVFQHGISAAIMAPMTAPPKIFSSKSSAGRPSRTASSSVTILPERSSSLIAACRARGPRRAGGLGSAIPRAGRKSWPGTPGPSRCGRPGSARRRVVEPARLS